MKGTLEPLIASALFVALFGVTYLLERPTRPVPKHRQPRYRIAFTIVLCMFSILFLVIGYVTSAAMLSTAIVVAIGVISRVKASHTRFNLVFEDISNLRGGIGQFLTESYRQTLAAAILASFTAIAFIVTSLSLLPSTQIQFHWRIIAVLTSAGLTFAAFRSFDWKTFYNFFVYPAGHSHVSSLFISAILANGPDPGFRMKDVGDTAIPLPPPDKEATGPLPHILIIQHESTFDPRIFEFPVARRLKAFINPPDGISGRLNVDAFGGYSWMTEFAFLTGISALSFPGSSRYIYYKSENKVRVSFVKNLKCLGYYSRMVTPTWSSFANYDRFYRSIGFDERIFLLDRGGIYNEPDMRRHFSDEILFDAVLGDIQAATSSGQPQLTMVLTNFNHGPHTMKRLRHRVSRKIRNFGTEVSGNPEYGEYYARMLFSIDCYNELKRKILEQFPNVPFLIVRYGDHHPSLSTSLAKSAGLDIADPRLHETFYALEGLNLDLDKNARPTVEPLDIAFLASVMMRSIRLPLAPIWQLQAQLIQSCGHNYDKSSSDDKREFHRTLIDNGFVDAQPLP